MKPLFPDIFVNGEKIPSAAVAAEAQNHPAPQGKPGMAWRAAAQALVVRQLLLAAAREADLKADPAMLSPGRIETGDEALIRSYLEANLTTAPVRDSEVLTIYRSKNPEGEMPANIANNIKQKLEQRAWKNAASDLVASLVADAQIFGIEMKPAG
jgi:hypothetical protein